MSNEWVELFRAIPGDTRDQLIRRFEAMLGNMQEWVKKGYEHSASECPGATVIDGEKRGGWIDAKTGKCSACGFWVGDLKKKFAELVNLLQDMRALPKNYVYGIPQSEWPKLEDME